MNAVIAVRQELAMLAQRADAAAAESAQGMARVDALHAKLDAQPVHRGPW